MFLRRFFYLKDIMYKDNDVYIFMSTIQTANSFILCCSVHLIFLTSYSFFLLEFETLNVRNLSPGGQYLIHEVCKSIIILDFFV